MAMTVTPQATDPQGGKGGNIAGGLRQTFTNVLFDATAYTAGGFALTPQQLSLGRAVIAANVTVLGPSTGAVTGGLGDVFYNTTTNKIQGLNSTGVEGAFAASLAGLLVQVQAWGY